MKDLTAAKQYDDALNLPSLFFDKADEMADTPFLWSKNIAKRIWESMSWPQVARDVQNLAKGLEAQGVKAGDRVLLLSENRPEWLIADIAIMCLGAITVPSYTTNTTENHLHVINDSGAKVAIVSTDALLQKFVPAAAASECNTIISIEKPSKKPAQGLQVKNWQAVLNEGRKIESDIRERAKDLKRSDTCCIIYTSGTGGVPAGVMLSHGAIICNCKGAHDALAELPNFGNEQEVFLSFLPLSHSYEHTAGQFFPIGAGAQIYYAEGIDKLLNNLAEVQPTIMTAVPRLYENIRGKVLRNAEKTGGLKEKLLMNALELGARHYEAPKSMSLGQKLFNILLDKLVRKKVQARFGGRLKAFVSGGAPLNYDVGLFFIALGLRVLQGYGQTETAPVVSVNRPVKNKLRTVGPALVDVDIKIAEDGEILIGGELCMNGYWNNPEKTASAMKDGWVHTGDIGKLDEDGYLMITDRKKDIIVNSGGDNLSPQRVEGIICLENEIAQCMVYGDRRPHLVAAIVPDFEALSEKGIDTNDDEAVNNAIKAAITRANNELSVIEKVRKFVLIKEAFSVENAMMTPSMKIRRHVIVENYGEELEALYS
ncbi:AMP-dependent synthetase/ligase [Curvivirga sp.]|uniref:AMP-dependent synthetase/ligase n=1 Tax=Curvivirga sp. TaxID=2856848 RepID=UPI003B5C0505